MRSELLMEPLRGVNKSQKKTKITKMIRKAKARKMTKKCRNQPRF